MNRARSAQLSGELWWLSYGPLAVTRISRPEFDFARRARGNAYAEPVVSLDLMGERGKLPGRALCEEFTVERFLTALMLCQRL